MGPTNSHVNPLIRAWAAPLALSIAGLRAIEWVNTRNSGFTCDQHTMPDTVVPKTQTTSPLAARFQCFSPRWSALWRPHRLEPRPRRHQSGGIATLEARHAGDTPPEGFAWRKTPTATSVERAAGAGGSGWGTGGWRKPGNCTHGRCHDETNLAQHEPHGPTSGTKLSQHTPRTACAGQNSPCTPALAAFPV